MITITFTLIDILLICLHLYFIIYFSYNITFWSFLIVPINLLSLINLVKDLTILSI